MWLIFGAFMFALGYEKTGLGQAHRATLVKAMGRRTLTLGYAIAAADLVLAPFTPSNTARSGGTDLSRHPHISRCSTTPGPNDPSARKIGSYIMWVAIAATSVTSSMFLTALAPNLLARRAGEEGTRTRDQLDAMVQRASCRSAWLLLRR